MGVTLLLAMAMDMVLDLAGMGMESVRLNQKLMLMLSMVLMEDMVLDTVLILWDMVMAILATLLLAMAVMDMESVMLMLSQSLMPSMERMVGMAMDLDTVHTPWDMDMDMVVDLAMVMDMDIMVELYDTTNQVRHYNDFKDNA